MERRIIVVTVLLISLCFLVIPIHVPQKNYDENIRLFETYIKHYDKSYRHDPREYDKRFQRFQRSLEKIHVMNNEQLLPASAVYGPTLYSDMSEEEFVTLFLHLDIPDRGFRQEKGPSHKYDIGGSNLIRFERATDIPMKVDWREKGAVSAIRNQGNCGACWAFSIVECIESMVAIKNRTHESYSVQEMIDCAGNGNSGCDGGDICSLSAWLVDNQVAILPEFFYPITGMSNVCQLDRFNASTVRVVDFRCDSFVNREDELIEILANHGPVAAAVNALTWQNYLSGIIQFHCDGDFSLLNHAVQIIGYDKSGPIPYYIVRNSWGVHFGDNGYLYIAIGSNTCGIANQISSLDVIW